jgi:tryptophan-rich sensory protein
MALAANPTATHDRLAGWLLAPYAAWVVFATTLNAAIVSN